MLRIVLDTNVLVSAIISEGKSRELFKKGIAKQYSIVVSDSIINELVTVLRRPKFKTGSDEVNRVILALTMTADIVDVKTKIKAVKGDPNDDMIIATAIDGSAETIVTGDSHLLTLGKYEGIEIITIEQMLTRLQT